MSFYLWASKESESIRLEEALESPELNHSLYKWENQSLERGRDLFMVTQLMEVEPGVKLKVLSPSPLCTNNMLQSPPQSRPEQYIFLQEGQGSALIAANRKRNRREGQDYLLLPFVS